MIVFSSLTKRETVDKIIKTYGFKFEILEEKQIPFEKLYVYMVMRVK